MQLFPRAFAAIVLLALRLHAQESLFDNGRTGLDSGPEGNFYELGTVFHATTPGAITHVRVYSLASETGIHSARIWRNSDNSLIGGPYSWNYGGTTGWITLDIPDVAISANTDYTVVVSTGDGGRNYAFRSADLASAGGNALHLAYPTGAGVFTTNPGTRPTQVFQNSNYYRDIVFSPQSPEPPTNAPVRINEFVAENKSGLQDENGESSDWIELYNPKGTAVDITGYQLTDGTATWTFPVTTIGPQQFLVVFASAKNRSTTPLHTNFKLEKAGEYLALKDASGTTISEFASFPNQREDVAFGRGEAGNIGYLPTPTPGSFNGPAYDGFVADTVFSPKRGFFTAPVQVSITTPTADATIRYTLNGTTPTETSTLYTGPLTISNTTTLRARAFRSGYLSTNVDTNTYLFAADVTQQTSATTQAYGWPSGSVNGQALRYGTNSPAATAYSLNQKTTALTQIPTLSVVTDQANLTASAGGIYVNASTDGLERPASLELINPDGSPGFQENSGLRIRGGQSRGSNFPKHSFNVFFRKQYGSGKLDFPLFGADGANKFDTISIRCEHGYAYADPYALNYRLEFTAIRDVVCRDLWAEAGFASTRSQPYHLYLNGQYWGLYQTQERAQEDFGATYFGGDPSEYDCVAATGLPQLTIEAAAGDLTAWTQLWSGARAVFGNPTNANYFALLGRNADGTPNPAIPVLLEPHELAAYMLVHYYTGHSDEPLSVSFGFEKPNNFRAIRRRGLTQPWHFLVHDGESSLRATEWVDNRANAVNLNSPNRNSITYSNPEWIHEDLLANPEYRIVVADETQRLLFNGGAFTATRAQSLWDERAAQINQAVIGESIRWAQGATETQANWTAKVNEVRTQFFPSRSATVISQMRQRNLFPSVDAPVFSQRGGQVSSGFQLSLTGGANGTIYYTTNGSDPRAIGGGIAGTTYAGPITISAATKIRVRFRSNANEWSALDEATFTTLPPATSANLIVSKVHYHPLPPTAAEASAGFTEANDFEYVELQNVSAETIDLRGVRVNAGIEFNFASASLGSLAAGARVVIAENTAAFAFRYGGGLPLAGAYTGNLGDGGETLRIIDTNGTNIALFTYDDATPWPTLPDGDGPALVLKAANLIPLLPESWRPSYSIGGKPGQLDTFTFQDWQAQYFSASDLANPSMESTLWGLSADPDTDGSTNLREYALGGTVPTMPGSFPSVTESFVTNGGQTYLQATYRIREGVTGITITAEVSSDLINWQPLTPVSSISQGDNTALITVQDSQPVSANLKRFVRVNVSGTP